MAIAKERIKKLDDVSEEIIHNSAQKDIENMNETLRYLVDKVRRF